MRGRLGEMGGAYDGLLLSSANYVAPELARVIQWAEAGRKEEAQGLSSRIASAVDTLREAVDALPFGNPFINSAKAFDHHFAHGREAEYVPFPMTKSGRRLPRDVVRLANEVLREHGLAPYAGYLD